MCGGWRRSELQAPTQKQPALGSQYQLGAVHRVARAGIALASPGPTLGEAPSGNCQVITSLAAPGEQGQNVPDSEAPLIQGYAQQPSLFAWAAGMTLSSARAPARQTPLCCCAPLASPRALQWPRWSRRGRSPSASSRLWSPSGSAFSSSSLDTRPPASLASPGAPGPEVEVG